MTAKLNLSKLYQLFLLMGCIALAAVWLSSVSRVAGQSQNLLLNGDFEEGYNTVDGNDSISVAVGWTPFWNIQNLDLTNNPTGDIPEFMASDSSESPFSRAFSGERSQLWHTKFSSAFAGIYQRVPMESGSTVRLSAWTYAWSSTGSNTQVSQNEAWMRQRIGIDPTGGTDPNSDTIVWSAVSQHVDVWGQLAVEATAESDHVTVFLTAYPNQVNPQNDVYYDQAELIVVSNDLPTPEPIVGSSGVPGLAPTIDPLLIGLITGQGTAPGTQGIDITSASSMTYPPSGGPSPWGNIFFVAISASMMMFISILALFVSLSRALATKPAVNHRSKEINQ
ncbi:MAG: hypothetical protein AAF633_08715 [Chloroflexota bacterium]